jgi:hypothetical protein
MKEKNKVSDKYFCKKFEREFSIVIQNMASEEQGWQES